MCWGFGECVREGEGLVLTSASCMRLLLLYVWEPGSPDLLARGGSLEKGQVIAKLLNVFLEGVLDLIGFRKVEIQVEGRELLEWTEFNKSEVLSLRVWQLWTNVSRSSLCQDKAGGWMGQMCYLGAGGQKWGVHLKLKFFSPSNKSIFRQLGSIRATLLNMEVPISPGPAQAGGNDVIVTCSPLRHKSLLGAGATEVPCLDKSS